MEIRICKTKEDLGKSAGAYTAGVLRDAIAKKGYARIVLSTGASQFDTLNHWITECSERSIMRPCVRSTIPTG